MDKKPLKDHVPAPESEEVTIPNDPMRALVNLTIDSALSKQFRKNSLITIGLTSLILNSLRYQINLSNIPL